MCLITIRQAVKEDVPVIVSLIRELAEYEKLLNEAVLTEVQLEHQLFGENPPARVLIAWMQDIPIGFALYFFNFSTFIGKPGLYLEDLYIRPDYRGSGLGKTILKALANIALENDCGRMEWSVLNWNTPAIEFYKSLGARAMEEWTTFRLNRTAIEQVAGK